MSVIHGFDVHHIEISKTYIYTRLLAVNISLEAQPQQHTSDQLHTSKINQHVSVYQPISRHRRLSWWVDSSYPISSCFLTFFQSQRPLSRSFPRVLRRTSLTQSTTLARPVPRVTPLASHTSLRSSRMLHQRVSRRLCQRVFTLPRDPASTHRWELGILVVTKQCTTESA